MQNSRVISTGGGCITRDSNIDLLKQNSRIIFINRSPERLITSEDRPLSKTDDAVKELYRQRYERYVSAADQTVNGDATPYEVAQKIVGGLKA